MIVVAGWVIHIASVNSGKQSVMGVARRDTCKKFAIIPGKVEKLYTVWKRV